MKKIIVAALLLLVGSFGCGKNFEWLPEYENMSGANGGSVSYGSKQFAEVTAGPATYVPSGVAVDNKNNFVYVADNANKRILRFKASGEFDSVFASGIDQTILGGIGVDADGRVYLVDPGENRINIYSAAGLNSPSFFHPVTGVTGSISDIAVAVSGSSGVIYVSVPGDDAVKKVVIAAGDIPSEAVDLGNGYSSPRGIAVDPLAPSNFFVANTDFITTRNASGGQIRSFGSDKLSSPIGVAATSTGYLYVGNSQQLTVEVFTLDGNYEGTLGKGASGTDTSVFTSASLLATDSSGSVYVAEPNRVLKLTRQ